MKEQFVPYDLAIKLQEKGFDEPCLAAYNQSDENKFMIAPQLSSYQIASGKNSDVGKIEKVTAPLWQQVIDWFREKHFIDIMIRQTQKDGTAYYKITKIETEDKIKGYSNFCKTVNIARQAVIEHALTLI